MNANHLTEALMTTFTTPEAIETNGLATALGGWLGLDNVACTACSSAAP